MVFKSVRDLQEVGEQEFALPQVSGETSAGVAQLNRPDRKTGSEINELNNACGECGSCDGVEHGETCRMIATFVDFADMRWKEKRKRLR